MEGGGRVQLCCPRQARIPGGGWVRRTDKGKVAVWETNLETHREPA